MVSLNGTIVSSFIHWLDLNKTEDNHKDIQKLKEHYAQANLSCKVEPNGCRVYSLYIELTDGRTLVVYTKRDPLEKEPIERAYKRLITFAAQRV